MNAPHTPTKTTDQQKPKVDARIVKTLKSIRKAFFALLTTKKYDAITIQDILDEAVINRTTFYKYYNNKQELALQLVNEIKEDFIVPTLEKRFNLSWEEFSKEFDRHWANQHKESLALFWDIDNSHIHLKKDIYALVKARYLKAHQGTKEWRASDLDFQAHMYATFVVANIKYMISHHEDDLEEPHVMHRNLRHLFHHMLN